MAEALAVALPSGYDDEFVNSVDEDLHCSICHLPLKEAVQTGKCGHRFCRQCLDEHFRRLELNREPLNCPVDRNILIRDKVSDLLHCRSSHHPCSIDRKLTRSGS
ncbi:hypothetical protein ABFA07_003197 [Porites harrisoni]